MHLTIDELIAYIDEERTRWEHWFSMNGNAPLRFTLAGETHPNVGALILHCFWTELWYASMLRGEMLTHDSNKEAGVDAQEITEAIEVGKMVRKSAASNMDKFASRLNHVTPSAATSSNDTCGCGS